MIEAVGKLLILSACVLTIHAYSEDIQELLDNLHSTCQAETGCPEETITAARKGDFSEDNRFKCYTYCVMEQMALVGEDGILDIEATLAVLPPELQGPVAPVMRACGAKQGADKCDSVWLTHKCFQAGGPEHYFLP